MIVAGCDVGSLTAKVVLMEDGKIIGSGVVRCGPAPENSAAEAMARALAEAGLTLEDIAYCVGTGYGKNIVSFVKSAESEIACHAKGAVWQNPSARTVIDIGGQDAKAIRIDEKGNVVRYQYNDKCASGTGRFLEVIADALDIGLENMGGLSKKKKKKPSEKLALTNQCVVFAETEIISLVNEGHETSDIVNALHHAVAGRVVSMANAIIVEDDVVMTGGVAKNEGMFEALGETLDTEILSVENPQINGAIGAALFAMESACGALSEGETEALLCSSVA